MDQGAEQGPSLTPPPAMNFVSFPELLLQCSSLDTFSSLCEGEASLL